MKAVFIKTKKYMYAWGTDGLLQQGNIVLTGYVTIKLNEVLLLLKLLESHIFKKI